MTGSVVKPLRIGLVGAGQIAGSHLAAFRELSDHIQLVAICDIDGAAAQRRATEAGITHVYTDVNEMLRAAPIDAVDICTIHDQHASIAIAAAQSGRHVLVEKPMACSVETARQMIEATERAGVTLMVAQLLRYQASSQAVRDAIGAGEIGRVRAIRMEVMFDFTRYYPLKSWAYDASRTGGGVVMMSAVHHLDLARYLLGEVQSVSAKCWTSRPDLFLNGAEDSATATLQFESGVVGDLLVLTSTPEHRPGIWWRILIIGDAGTISADAYAPDMVLRSLTLEISDDRPGYPTRQLIATDQKADPFAAQLLHFAEACRTGVEPLSSGRDNLQTMRLIAAIYESARTGAPVALAQL